MAASAAPPTQDGPVTTTGKKCRLLDLICGQLTTTNQAALPKRKKTKRRPGAFRAVTTTDYQHRLANLVHVPVGQTKWKIDLGRHVGRCPQTTEHQHLLGELFPLSIWANLSRPRDQMEANRPWGNARRGPTSNRRTTPLGEPVPLPICTTLSRPCGQMENRPPWRVRANPKRTPTKNSSCKPELIDDFSHAWPDKRPGSSPNTCDFAFFEANPSTKTMLGRDTSENVPN